MQSRMGNSSKTCSRGERSPCSPSRKANLSSQPVAGLTAPGAGVPNSLQNARVWRVKKCCTRWGGPERSVTSGEGGCRWVEHLCLRGSPGVFPPPPLGPAGNGAKLWSRPLRKVPNTRIRSTQETVPPSRGSGTRNVPLKKYSVCRPESSWRQS